MKASFCRSISGVVNYSAERQTYHCQSPTSHKHILDSLHNWCANLAVGCTQLGTIWRSECSRKDFVVRDRLPTFNNLLESA